ncbi:MAG: hypothetical protein Q9227_002965 [Pyrenula ochraceoflavens]
MRFSPLLAIQGGLWASRTAASLSCSGDAIAPLLPSGASLNFAVSVPANGSFGQAPEDLEFPYNATGLPSLCALSVNVISSNSSSYNFGLFLPVSWNQRFATGGNGGFGGGINWPDMGTFSNYGFAAMATDTGHISATGNASWALNHPESIIDWGYRAMHGSVVLGKQIVNAYYGSNVSYSYYASCSTGGRQGLKEVQVYPEDFDGVLVGAPAWWTTHLQTWSVEVGLLNLPNDSPSHIPSSLFPTIQAEVNKQCDPQDGVTDGIISSPSTCSLDLSTLLCTSSSTNSSSCLSPAQLTTLSRIYTPYYTTNSTFLFPALTPGSEPGWSGLLGPTDNNTVSPLGYSYIQSFLLNSSSSSTYDYTTYTDSLVSLADALDPGNATADSFDLSAFRARGGKLIHYHGWADPLIPTGSSVYYRQQVEKTMLPSSSSSSSSSSGITNDVDVDIDNFYRFYLIPGMGHCQGSSPGVDAPWYIAGGGQAQGLTPRSTYSVPGFQDEKHDALLAMMGWVERGDAPEEIVATKFRGDSVAEGVERQRPLCRYPLVARFDQSRGGVDEAGAWACERLY